MIIQFGLFWEKNEKKLRPDIFPSLDEIVSQTRHPVFVFSVLCTYQGLGITLICYLLSFSSLLSMTVTEFIKWRGSVYTISIDHHGSISKLRIESKYTVFNSNECS